MGFMGLDGEDTAPLIMDRLSLDGTESQNAITAASKAIAQKNKVVIDGGNGAIDIQPFITDQPAVHASNEKGVYGAAVYSGFVSSQTTTYSAENGLNGNQVTRIPDNIITCGYDAHHVKLPANSIAKDIPNVTLSFPNEQNGDYMLVMAYLAIETQIPLKIGDMYYYTDVANKTATLTHASDGIKYSGDVVIPSEIEYEGEIYTVKTVGYYAFEDCDDLTSVTIPNSITDITESAFDGCSELTNINVDESNAIYKSVNGVLFSQNGETLLIYPKGRSGAFTMPDGVTNIGSEAFKNCHKLTGVTISNSVINIGNDAFANCSGLTEITIPSSVTDIAISAFSGCTSLTDIKVDDNNTAYKSLNGTLLSKDGETLWLCPEGKSGEYSIPNGVTNIGSMAFNNCNRVTSLKIPSSLATTGTNAFDGCDKIAEVTLSGNQNMMQLFPTIYKNFKKGEIAEGVIAIGDNVFSGCTGLTEVIIPNSVTSIGASAFYNCSGLAEITIPSSVTSIGSSAFYNCTGLKEVINKSELNIIKGSTANGYVAYYADVYNGGKTVIGDFIFSDRDKTLKKYTGNGGDVTLPENFKGGNYTIWANAFSNCTGLASVTIPSSVTSVGNSAFSGCTGLTSVTIPNSVTSIEGSVFSGCTGLTEVIIPNSVTSIGASAFSGCSGFAEITIPSSVTSIESSAFYGCTSLKEVINKSELNIVKGSTGNGYVAYYADIVYNGGRTVIGDFIFSDQDNALVKYTGNGGDITLPENFKGGNYYIGADAFSGNSTLTSITIPNSVTNIEDYAFSGCSGLLNINVAEDNENYTSIDGVLYSKDGTSLIWFPQGRSGSFVIPTIVTTINSNALSAASGISSITFSKNIKSIPSISGCTSLKDVVWDVEDMPDFTSSPFPDCVQTFTTGANVKRIPANICYRKPSLNSVTITNNVENIGARAFSNCANLPNIDLAVDNQNYMSLNNAIYSKDGMELIYVPAGVSSFEIPNSVKSIGAGAFGGCQMLTEITIPEGIENISSIAFENCSNIKTINWNAINCNDFTSNSPFKDSRMTVSNVNIGDNVEHIPAYLCYWLEYIDKVSYPNSVKTIGINAFTGVGMNNRKNVLLYSTDFTGWTAVDYSYGSSLDSYLQTSGDGAGFILSGRTEINPTGIVNGFTGYYTNTKSSHAITFPAFNFVSGGVVEIVYCAESSSTATITMPDADFVKFEEIHDSNNAIGTGYRYIKAGSDVLGDQNGWFADAFGWHSGNSVQVRYSGTYYKILFSIPSSVTGERALDLQMLKQVNKIVSMKVWSAVGDVPYVCVKDNPDAVANVKIVTDAVLFKGLLGGDDVENKIVVQSYNTDAPVRLEVVGDDAEKFTLPVTEIADASAGVEVSVLYTPSAVKCGKSEALLKVSSADESIKPYYVRLQGVTSVNDGPQIVAETSTLKFLVNPIGKFSQRIGVLGLNLTGTVSAQIEGRDASLFSLDKTEVSVKDASYGDTLAITYRGDFHQAESEAYLVFSSPGASPVRVPLLGKTIENEKIILQKFKVYVSPSGSGYTEKNLGGEIFSNGEIINVSVLPEEGYKVKFWSDNVTCTDKARSVMIDSEAPSYLIVYLEKGEEEKGENAVDVPFQALTATDITDQSMEAHWTIAENSDGTSAKVYTIVLMDGQGHQLQTKTTSRNGVLFKNLDSGTDYYYQVTSNSDKDGEKTTEKIGPFRTKAVNTTKKCGEY